LPGPESPRAVVFGCAGPTLSDSERELFRDADPLGFILFRRNCVDPDQVRTLVADLRDAVGRACPVLIDQEGGRVQRLRAPHWYETPSAARLAAIGGEAVALAYRLIAQQLANLGVTVDCAPVLDLARPETTDAIGDRAFSSEIDAVTALGRAAIDGLMAGGILPVIKHMPGHGRATVDSHHDLPRVSADRATLATSDFAPFRALSDAPWGMTTHIVFDAVDPERPATCSPTVIEDVIRGEIGFEGVLVSDDIAMQALSGSPAERAQRALAAGCDVVLDGAGDLEAMRAVAAQVPPLTDAAQARLERAEARRPAPDDVDPDALAARLDVLLASGQD